MDTGYFIKRALHRESGYPVGVPAPMFLMCECGAKVSVATGFQATAKCACGIEYSETGWIVSRPEAA